MKIKKYLHANSKVIRMIIAAVLFLGPIFSIVLTPLSIFLNRDLGDWLSFYGTMAGIVVSVMVIHFQMFLDKEKEIERVRPEFVMANNYQLIKDGCRIYYDDKYWFHLVKKEQPNKLVESNSFEKAYSEENKRDKIFSLEIVNNQPIFKVHILFGDHPRSEFISKIGVDQRVYLVSKSHLEQIHLHLSGKKAEWHHVPDRITIYFTTLSGEVCQYTVELNDKGYGMISKKEYGVNYPETLSNSYICDYFVSK